MDHSKTDREDTESSVPYAVAKEKHFQLMYNSSIPDFQKELEMGARQAVSNAIIVLAALNSSWNIKFYYGRPHSIGFNRSCFVYLILVTYQKKALPIKKLS